MSRITAAAPEMLQMYESGSRLVDIAESFGCHINTVRYHLSKTGASMRSFRDYTADKEVEKRAQLPSENEVATLYESGMKMREIADVYGCSPSAVFARLKAAGVETRDHTDYPITETQRSARRKNGASMLGVKRTDETKARISKAKKKYRKRDDYEFGGHEKKRSDGYVQVFVPDHPHATSDGFVMRHTLVMEREIGRLLNTDEVVHHINRIRDDNRIENLLLMTKREHNALHARERKSNTQPVQQNGATELTAALKGE